MRERFMHAITHDLNQPLSALRFHLKCLQRESDTPAVANFANTAEACLISSEAIVESVAGSAWLHRDIPEAELETIALAPLFSALRDQMAARADHYGLTIQIAPTSLAVYADRAYLERVLRNLLQNAIQFAATRVLIGVRRSKDRVKICVVDDGPGVPLEQRKRIFERFSHVKQVARRETGNVGLGLSIVSELTAKMGGAAGIADGNGGRFFVELRRADLASPAIAPGRALVIDDDPSDREEIVAALNAAGWTVDAPSAIARNMLVGVAGYDLRVLDGSLGDDLTAIDLVEATGWKDAKRTIVASRELTPDFVRRFRSQGVRFQQKPFSVAAVK